MQPYSICKLYLLFKGLCVFDVTLTIFLWNHWFVIKLFPFLSYSTTHCCPQASNGTLKTKTIDLSGSDPYMAMVYLHIGLLQLNGYASTGLCRVPVCVESCVSIQ